MEARYSSIQNSLDIRGNLGPQPAHAILPIMVIAVLRSRPSAILMVSLLLSSLSTSKVSAGSLHGISLRAIPNASRRERGVITPTDLSSLYISQKPCQIKSLKLIACFNAGTRSYEHLGCGTFAARPLPFSFSTLIQLRRRKTSVDHFIRTRSLTSSLSKKVQPAWAGGPGVGVWK